MRYVAFLRGINVGGKTKVPMEELRQIFERLGFTEVKTLLNSGNVIFTTAEKPEEVLQQEIEQALERQFGFPIRTFLRPEEELRNLVQADPFNGIPVTKETRLYVTFLSDPHTFSLQDVQKTAGNDAQITRLTKREVCSVITVTSEKNTTDLMTFLGKIFGKNVTTRNWNTIQKIVTL